MGRLETRQRVYCSHFTVAAGATRLKLIANRKAVEGLYRRQKTVRWKSSNRVNKLRRRNSQMKDSRPQHCPGNNVTVKEQMKYCSLGITTEGKKINALHKACGHRFCKDASKRVLRVPDTSVSHSPEPHPTSTFELAAEIPISATPNLEYSPRH